MTKFNILLNHHHEGMEMPDLGENRKDYLIFCDGSWFMTHWESRKYNRDGWFQSPEGICFMEDDDFLWGELPEEVDDEN